MKRLRLQAGSNLVEFALVLPLLLVLVFGIVDFGLLLFDKAVITNAAREGARAGMVFRDPRMTAGEIRTVVENYAAAHLVSFRPANMTISPTWTGTQSSGDTLTVTVTYQYNYLVMSMLVPVLDPEDDGMTLTSTSVMRYE